METDLCPDCLRLMEAWKEAAQELSHRNTTLLSTAGTLNPTAYTEEVAQLESAQLRVENIRTALRAHRATHSPD